MHRMMNETSRPRTACETDGGEKKLSPQGSSMDRRRSVEDLQALTLRFRSGITQVPSESAARNDAAHGLRRAVSGSDLCQASDAAERPHSLPAASASAHKEPYRRHRERIRADQSMSEEVGSRPGHAGPGFNFVRSAPRRTASSEDAQNSSKRLSDLTVKFAARKPRQAPVGRSLSAEPPLEKPIHARRSANITAMDNNLDPTCVAHSPWSVQASPSPASYDADSVSPDLESALLKTQRKLEERRALRHERKLLSPASCTGDASAAAEEGLSSFADVSKSLAIDAQRPKGTAPLAASPDDPGVALEGSRLVDINQEEVRRHTRIRTCALSLFVCLSVSVYLSFSLSLSLSHTHTRAHTHTHHVPESCHSKRVGSKRHRGAKRAAHSAARAYRARPTSGAQRHTRV